MPIDTQRCYNDQQQEMDFLRGASHALSALANPELKPDDALRAVNYLRGKAAAGRKVPPLMWFLGYVSTGRSPDSVYQSFMSEQEVERE